MATSISSIIIASTAFATPTTPSQIDTKNIDNQCQCQAQVPENKISCYKPTKTASHIELGYIGNEGRGAFIPQTNLGPGDTYPATVAPVGVV